MGLDLGLLAKMNCWNSNSNFNKSYELHRLAVFQNNNKYDVNIMVN
jgi:hypothetical protein